MSGKTAAGSVMMVIGVVMALWGISFVNSVGQQLAEQFGMRDNTGLLAIGGGAAIAIIGLVLVLPSNFRGIGQPPSDES